MKRLFPLGLLVAAAFAWSADSALAEDAITVGFTASQTGPLNVDSLGLVRGYEMWRDGVACQRRHRLSTRWRQNRRRPQGRFVVLILRCTGDSGASGCGDGFPGERMPSGSSATERAGRAAALVLDRECA